MYDILLRHQKPWPYQRPNLSHPLAKGLVSCLTMNPGEKGGGFIYDLSGYGINGVISGADWIGNKLRFVSASSDTLYATGFSISYPFSIACKASCNQLTANDIVVSIGDVAGTTYFALGFGGDQAGDPVIMWQYDGNSEIAETPIAYTANKMHSLVGVCESDSNRSVYMDGGNYGVNTNAQSAVAKTRLSIGVSADSTPFGYLDGDVEYAYVYDRVLLPSEIAWLHREPYAMFEQPTWLFKAPVVGGLSIPVAMYHRMSQ